MQGRCVCGDWDCPYHGAAEDYEEPKPEPCKHCDKFVRPRPFTTWAHLDGTRLCHPSLNDDHAEPAHKDGMKDEGT
jgi:hypothetical protein